MTMALDRNTKGNDKNGNEPISLIRGTPEEALSAFMQVDPAKVEENLKKKGVTKKK